METPQSPYRGCRSCIRSSPEFGTGHGPEADVALLSPIKDHHAERRLFISRILLAVFVARRHDALVGKKPG